jgi:hypothetical protein
MSEPTAPQQAGIRELIARTVNDVFNEWNYDGTRYDDLTIFEQDRLLGLGDRISAALASATEGEVQGLLDTHKRAVVRFDTGTADYDEVTAAETQIKALSTATRRAEVMPVIDDAAVERARKAYHLETLKLVGPNGAAAILRNDAGPAKSYGRRAQERCMRAALTAAFTAQETPDDQ